MIARVSAAPIHGSLTPPASKSAAHRALIAAGLAAMTHSGAACRVSGLSGKWSQDIAATVRALRALGVSVEPEGNALRLETGKRISPCTIDCGESGSTLRFLIPIAAVLGVSATFIGTGRLPKRPLDAYRACLPSQGVSWTAPGADSLPLTVGGRLRGGRFLLPGDVSSQFISGLLFALPLCEENSAIRLTSPLESGDYVAMTLETLRKAGIVVQEADGGWDVPGNQSYRPRDYLVESDWSQAAFLLAAGALGGAVTLRGIDPDSAQGDRRMLPLLASFGAAIRVSGGEVHCEKRPLWGIPIDAREIPDLVPILSVVAAAADGETHIYNAGRLRLKESDRLSAMADGLRRLGGQVTEQPDGLLIRGGARLAGGEVSGYNDHRIVMSLSVAALLCDGPVTISDAQSVQKSWPSFFEDYRKIGGIVHVVDEG